MAPNDERIEAWGRSRNILCVRLDNMGDVLMTVPAIRALRNVHPARRITLLGSPSGVEASALIPEIDAAIPYEAPWMKASRSCQPAKDLAISRALEAKHFDAAVIFTVYSQNPLPAALLCYLAGIPLRLAHCRENPYGLLSDWIPETEPAAQVRHEVQRQLDLVANVGAETVRSPPRMKIPAHARRAASRALLEWGVPESSQLVVLHPGATAASRTYPAERFAEVARILSDDAGAALVVTGTADERALAQSICGSMRIVNAAGRLTLAELCALIDRADLLVSNNTGPVHIASTVGTPVVDLYALTNPQHTPWNVPCRVLFHDVPCRYCYKSVCPQGHGLCLRGVTVRQVVDAALELLAGKAGKPIRMPTPASHFASRPLAA